jgi:hypothetical protein
MATATRTREILPVGLLVTYEDMANPLRTFRVEATPDNWSDYCLTDVETGEIIYSDCRQCGWKPVYQACPGCNWWGYSHTHTAEDGPESECCKHSCGMAAAS